MADLSKGRGGRAAALTAELFSHKVIIWWLPLLYLLISSLFYLRTYDSAQVKISVMQMGGLALAVLWVARLIEAGPRALNKNDLVCLAPFLTYLAVGVFSFIHAPYNMASVDFFLRHVFFMVVALIVIYEFDEDAAQRLTRLLVLAGWIAVGYGFVQFIDVHWFPPGVGKGLDPFIWRAAFGQRVFSTYGNPNFFADFLVIIFPILVTQYLKTRQTSLLPLMVMLGVDLIGTGTKGAWIGFVIVLFLFGVIAFVYFKEAIAGFRNILLGGVAVGILALGGVLAKDISARLVSVNFRLFTWEATWEMIRTQPILGSGVGSFPPLYPAFRRPPIFHIEGKHNTETDHAEDEYLEELFDNGILGFGVFVWLVYSTLVVGFRSLGQLTTMLTGKDGRPPPRAYDLIGYLVAFMGMLGHNFFDVSLRFVSSGVFLGLLSGMIVNLARGKGLYELHGLREAAGGPAPVPDPLEAPSSWKTIADFLIWPARLAAWAGLAYAACVILKEFTLLQGPLERLSMGGEVLQWWLAWLTLASCVVSLTLIFMRLTHLSDNPAVPLIILLALKPLELFWGYFKADVHHNIAIYFSKDRQWDRALENYLKVRQYNPDFVMASYFMGNVFNDRFSMEKTYNPGWGDRDNKYRDDYERAMESYTEVRRLAPNYVQTHHQVGVLHLKRAQWAMDHGHPEEAPVYLERAMTRFRLYREIDPVFPPNYYRMGQVYLMQHKPEEAVRIYKQLIDAERCAVDPALMAKPFLRRTVLAYQPYVEEPGQPYPVHRHESAEAYTNLANAYFVAEKFVESEQAYRRALALEPGYEHANKNLSVLYGKAQTLGRLKKAAPGMVPDTRLFYTGYEVLPPKK